MSRRKDAETLSRWETATREWATDTARELALALYHQHPPIIAPYGVGVILDPDEVVWVEAPMRFDLDSIAGPMFDNQRHPIAPPAPLVRPWLITNTRVVSRLGDDRLHGWRWENVTGLRVDLTSRDGYVALDVDASPPLVWRGPGVAPLAVAAVFHLHGPAALVDHPGLVPLRTLIRTRETHHADTARLELADTSGGR